MNPINVAVIGAGYWGPNLVRNLLSIPDCRLVAVCDKSSGRRSYIEEKFPHVRTVASLDDVVSDANIQAVFVVTPVSTHESIATAAIEAGKHVFVEKPLAGSAEEASRLVALAEKKNRTLAVGHLFAYHPAITTLKEMADRGEIGRLCYAESGRINLGPPASEVDVIWDLAVHDIAILLYLTGEQPAEVVAYGSRVLHPTLRDVAFIRVQFPSGFFSQHHVSWMSPDKVRRFSVFGSNGSLCFDDMAPNGKLRFVDRGIDTRVNLKDNEKKELAYKPGRVEFPELPSGEPLNLECRHFLDCVKEGRTPRTDGRVGLTVVRVLESALRSIAGNSRPVLLEENLTASR